MSVAILILAVVFGGAFLNMEAYLEFFSDGPPYFGRRENMDKWSDPRPVLGAVDAGILMLLLLLLRIWKAAAKSFAARHSREAN
jgi:hypothetical protein